MGRLIFFRRLIFVFAILLVGHLQRVGLYFLVRVSFFKFFDYFVPFFFGQFLLIFLPNSVLYEQPDKVLVFSFAQIIALVEVDFVVKPVYLQIKDHWIIIFSKLKIVVKVHVGTARAA
jgi:hypothetical protein